MLSIDLNCDMGEGCGNDAELMKYISSANVACGFHAGDRQTMRETVELALANNVAVGAHPGYPDRENFGRYAMELSSKEVFDLVIEQIEALREVCEESGAILHHVKPHGALYNQAAKDGELASAIAEAVARYDPNLILYGLSGSLLIAEGEAAGLKTASEVFADRTYQFDGSLTPRTDSNALISDVAESIGQVMQMIETQTVRALTGENVSLRPDTVCIHGDGEHAVEFTKAIREALANAGVRVMSPSVDRPAV